MGDLVNLRRVRKAKARADREAQAAARRAAHGRSAADRAASAAEVEKGQRFVDAHRLASTPGTDEPR